MNETARRLIGRPAAGLLLAGTLSALILGLLPGRAPAVERLRELPAAQAVHASEPRPRLDPVPLDSALLAVRAEVRRGAFPGAALAAGRGSRVQLARGVGATSWQGEPVDAERTVYDLASLTKVVATTTAAMLLYEDGRLELDAPVARYLPEFAGGGKSAVTVRALLTHTSGLPAWAEARGATPEARLAALIATPLKRTPGAKVEYSDVGFVTLFAALQRAAGEPLPALLERRVYGPLGMKSTRYAPGAACTRCAPTRRDADGKAVRGVVHDPIARALGGVAGNAGLFSTAADLSRFAAMLAGGGELEGVRILKPETIDTFAAAQAGAGTRALGWEKPDPRGIGAAGRSLSPKAFGHTGFTGTSLWVDPRRGTWAVLLTNRVYDPHASNQIQKLRRTVHDYLTEASE